MDCEVPLRFAEIQLNFSDDHFSELSDDCLMDILARVDHNDIDEFAILSQRMNSLSKLSRSKAIKLEADTLFFTQNEHRRYTTANGSLHFQCYAKSRTCEGCGVFEPSFWFKIKVDKQWYCVCARKTVEKPWKMVREKEFNLTAHYIVNLNAKEAIDGAEHIMQRFNFLICRIQLIQIEDDFLDYFEHVISTRSFAKLEPTKLNYDDISNHNIKKRFASLLLATSPREIESYYCSYNPFVDANFLVNFAQAFPLVEFAVYDRNEEDFEETGEETEFNPNDPLTSDDRLSAFLPRFKNLHMRCLVVNIDSLIPALLSRGKMAIDGKWEFRVTRNFSQAEIETLMGSEIEFEQYNGKVWWDNGKAAHGQIESMTTGQIDDKDRTWSFYVYFADRK
ncbi:hypothetical protein PENTCL1PPCAC_23992 [Pristionchus entomophagus]|uniref:F-box domain-containing protein n=1 Tax=Pristionchus entomophagus TaxID=358040 RepID=A0AAV5U5B3_9BILA|nr:hypothetical protein PENTCL1PPCAC_23992 [Pristionchus entomophagus]